MKKYYLLLSVLLFSLSVMAQKLEVVSFEAALTDNTAWNPSTCHKLDDGRYCPVVKVEFNAPSCAFEGGVIEGKAPLFKTNEYWVYMLPGARHIVIKHPDYEKLDVFFDEVNADIVRLKEKVTYILKLKGEVKKGLESVEKGEAAAMLKMAQNFEQGTGAYNRNIQQAQEWYEKAAEAGSEEAQNKLAVVLYEGSNGFSVSSSKALRWNEVLAKKGNVDAILRTAKLYDADHKNQQAINWYVKYNEQRPHHDLQMKIAQLYSYESPEKNKWLRIAADNGDVEAAYELATRLASTDSQTAAIYYQKAIDGGHVKAMTDYGYKLFYGEDGIEADYKNGRSLLELATSKGSNEAKGILDIYDLKVKQDDEMASFIDEIPQLKSAAIGGDINALYRLYLIYSASGDQQKAQEMAVALLYNADIVLPYEKQPELLLKRAYKIELNNHSSLNTKRIVDAVLSGNLETINDEPSMKIIQSWAKRFYEQDCLNYLINKRAYPMVDTVNNLYTYKLLLSEVEELKKKISLYPKKVSKYARKNVVEPMEARIRKIEEMLNNANVTDIDKQFTPWLQKLISEEIIWGFQVQKKVKTQEAERQKEIAKLKVQRYEEDIKNKIRERGKKAGVKTFEVNGIPFNMVLIRPNPKAKYGDWNSGTNHSAPRSSYYIAETEVTVQLYNAVMGKAPTNSQEPLFIRDTNEFWDVLLAFIKKINKLTGKRFRIPTHEEWEYAAHGGAQTGTPYCVRDYGVGRYFSYEVAKDSPNELGLYDILSGTQEVNGDYNCNCNLQFNKGYTDCFGLRLALSAQ